MRIAHPMTFTLPHSPITKLFRIGTHYYPSLFSPILSLNNPHSFLTTVALMASNSSADVDAKSGFTRPEMYKENLAGTVDAYDRHVFLCYKNHLAWPPRVEASDDDPLVKRVASAWKNRKNELAVKVSAVSFAILLVPPRAVRARMRNFLYFDFSGFGFCCLQTKITVCEAREEAGFSDGDLLIFPDMIKYR